VRPRRSSGAHREGGVRLGRLRTSASLGKLKLGVTGGVKILGYLDDKEVAAAWSDG